MIGTRDIVIDEELIRQNSFDVAVGNYIEITVEDTGTGIPKEIIDRIFEPFFTTKGVGKGTGLGLSAVYGSVKEHHGAIKVSSEVNVGTVFNIYLPTHEGVMVSNTHAGLDVVPAPGGSGCILLIDDEKIIRTASKNLLEDLGYEVLLAENGVEGVEVYRAHVDKIKVVILDMVMPKMNGANCFYQIRKINPEAKVLMASGFSGNAVIGTLKHDGLAGFINKPYRSFEIARILKEVLSR